MIKVMLLGDYRLRTGCNRENVKNTRHGFTVDRVFLLRQLRLSRLSITD